jgi:hypothetical protein
VIYMKEEGEKKGVKERRSEGEKKRREDGEKRMEWIEVNKESRAEKKEVKKVLSIMIIITTYHTSA